MRVLIVGCGYVGSALGADLVRRGHEVFGLSRTMKNENELRKAGVQAVGADITKLDSLLSITGSWDWIVNCVSSSRGSLEDYRTVYLEGTRNLLQWLSKSSPRKFVYTSTTSVYAQTDASVVTESSETKPESETGRILLETERLLRAATAEQRFPAIILRVSGIYGPGRGYWLKQFINDEATMDKAGERVLNMVHRDDVVGAIMAALEKGEIAEVYNVSDGEPVTQRTLFEWLSQKLDKPLPPAAEDDGVSRRKRELTSKRVSNRRLKMDLGYQLKYPTFREGFGALLNGDI
jgi:nucleoside-diphosphate-sugar epimerase